MGDLVKQVYFALEDKWYAGLDWLDQHGVPVYKVIDPIDTKIPSFALASLLLTLGLLFTFFSFGGLLGGGNVDVTFLVVDGDSSPLPNVPIEFTYQGNTQVLTSDTLGEISLSVPSGTKIDYEVDTSQYEVVRASFVPTATNKTQVIALQPLQSQNLTKTIKLVNSVGQPILNEAQLTFACSSSYATAPAAISGAGGVFTVTPNSDCGNLLVTVEVPGFETVQSFKVTKDVQNIILTEKFNKDATIVVTVKDQVGAAAPNLFVSAQKEGLEVAAGVTDAVGTSALSVSAGSYKVVVSDSLGIFTSASQDVFVESGATAQVNLVVTKNAVGSIEVNVKDKLSNAALKDAIVKLKEGNTVLQTVITDSAGKATLGIPDKTKSYTISGSAEGYIPIQQTVQGSTTATVVLALEKFNGTNGAEFKILVEDQDEVAVEDAYVVLYNADTGFLSPYPQVITDSNGVAKFKNVVTGNYKAFAYKKGLSAQSVEHFFAIDDVETHLLGLTLEVPDGTVSIHVVDNQGQPVSFAKVSVYNAFKGQLLGADLTDANGTYVMPRDGQRSKADKDVFVVVSKTGYATLTSVQKPVLPEATQYFEIVLPPTQPTGTIKMDLVGLFDGSGKIVTSVGKNKDYVARFRVSVPEEQDDLDTMDVHIRTGEKDIVEKDEWYVQSIRFPNTVVVKGSSWDPANGVNVDGESITFDAAKWVNAFHNNPQPGIYEFEVVLHVRNTATPQEALKLFYKARAENGEILRDPFDANPVDELYAATKSATYQVGVTTLCDKEFCFDSSILDVSEGIIEDVTEQFSAQSFKDYRLTFNLLNNGTGFHTNSNLRIRASNEGVEFTTYEIFNADNTKLSGTVNDDEFKTPLNAGSFVPQKKIGGTVNFRPRVPGTTLITFELVSDFQVVFSKSIQVNITGNKDLTATILPTFYPSQAVITLNVHAEDKATGDEADNALVSLENNLGIVLATKTTDAAGNAEIDLPAQAPGKKIFLKVEKAEFNPYVQTLEISDKILAFNPETLGVSLNAKTQVEKTTPVTLTNQTTLPLTVKSMVIQGNLQGILDKEKIESALLPYVGTIIPANGQLVVNLKSVLTPEARALLEHADLEVVLNVIVESYGTQWSFDLPVKYGIGINAPVDDPTCFNAVPRTWQTSSDGQTVTYEFQIQNNCAIGGTPVSLRNLAARADWSGNELGEVVLSVFKQESPTAIGATKVRAGYFSTFLTTINPQESIIARLDFTPYGGVKGASEVGIVLQAENPQQGKPQLVTSTVNAELTVVNLRDCVIYDKEILDLVVGSKDSFTIEAKGCGAPVEVSLQTDLEVNLKQFTLQGDGKQTIEVNDNQLDLGQYPIYVQLEGNENKVPQQAKVLRVRVRDPNACIQLNRYEFDVFDDPANDTDGFDTARLENYCAQQKVRVKVKVEKKFIDSLKKGMQAGIFAFLGTAATNWLNDKPFLGKVAAGTAADQAAGGAQPGTVTGGNTLLATVNQNKLTLNSMSTQLAQLDQIPQSVRTDAFQQELAAALLAQTNAQNANQQLEKLSAQNTTTGSQTLIQSFNTAVQSFNQHVAAAKVEAENSSGSSSIAPAPGIPSTGLVVLLQSNDKSVQESVKDSAIGQAVGSITDKLSLGTSNPWVSFGVVTLGVALFDYFGTDEPEFDVTVLGKDVEIDSMRMVAGEKGGNESVADSDIQVTRSGIALLPKINLERPAEGKVEAESLTFTNISQFVNQTIFRSLLVLGKRFEYVAGETYKNEIPDENQLKTNAEDDFKSKFHLQFNSIPPESLFSTAVPPIALSCDTFSEKTGKTGTLAAPKVAFSWNFQDISYDACDVGKVNSSGAPTHVYCDATQFSIELLQKVQTLRQFIEQNAPFACPIQDELSGTKTQTIPAADIGISSISIDKISTTDVNVIVGIQNNAPAQNNAKVSITYKLNGSVGAGTTLTKNQLIPTGGSKVNVGFVISNLAAGNYVLNANIVPEECENCFNSQPASDQIQTEFFIGSGSNLVACEPFSTTRLGEFINASEQAGQNLTYPAGFDKASILNLVNFRAHLMQDRFSPDFYTDFDRYARNVSFFDAPTYYLDQQNGLSRFFRNREKWIVQREGTPIPPEGYLLPGPGIYDVTLDIVFEDAGMDFFLNGEPDAQINVLVEKTSTTEEVSPFYYLPFNGLIGTDDGQGRVGYGLNYEGENVKVNTDLAESVNTLDVVNSTPVATLQTSKVGAYNILNSVDRGTILSITQQGTQQLAMKWSPSFATPVMMTIENSTIESDVYGFYAIGIGNDTSQSYVGAQGNPWYGVGPNCRDFADNGVLDFYSPRYDSSAINADCALTGAQENIAYGFEWCQDVIHAGKTNLKTIFYTPQDSQSQITRVAWKTNMEFTGEQVKGGAVPLNGTNVISGNTPGDTLNSVEQVLNLVKQEDVCVRNTGAKVEFFWNPKEVMNAIAQQEKQAETMCILN